MQVFPTVFQLVSRIEPFHGRPPSQHASGGKAKFTLLRKASVRLQHGKMQGINSAILFPGSEIRRTIIQLIWGEYPIIYSGFRRVRWLALGFLNHQQDFHPIWATFKKTLTQMFQVGIIFLQHGYICKWGWSSKPCSLIPVYLQILASEKKTSTNGLGPVGISQSPGPKPTTQTIPKPTTQTISWNERSTKKIPSGKLRLT